MHETVLPSLLDRLTTSQTDVTAAQLRQHIRRDLEQLLNARACRFARHADALHLRRSVTSYGLPRPASHVQMTDSCLQFEAQQLAATIARFEPRLQDVRVMPLPYGAQQLPRFRIEAQLPCGAAVHRIAFHSMLEPVSSLHTVTWASP